MTLTRDNYAINGSITSGNNYDYRVCPKYRGNIIANVHSYAYIDAYTDPTYIDAYTDPTYIDAYTDSATISYTSK